MSLEPGRKNYWTGKQTKKEDDHLKKMIGMKNIEEKNCSIISILLNMHLNWGWKNFMLMKTGLYVE